MANGNLPDKIFTNKFSLTIFVLILLAILALWALVGKSNRDLLSAKQINMSYHGNIIADAHANADFRRVLFTGKNSQLVIMSIPKGGEVGKETHKYTEQTLFFLSGNGQGELDGKSFKIVAGDVIIVPAGTEHNFWNSGEEPLQIYTVYSPANHLDGRVHHSKAEADADLDDEAVGETAPLK